MEKKWTGKINAQKKRFYWYKIQLNYIPMFSHSAGKLSLIFRVPCTGVPPLGWNIQV